MSLKLSPTERTQENDRDQFIPVRKRELIAALLRDGRMNDAFRREQFRQLCRLLAAIFHYEYFEWLEKLRDDYHYFNPDTPLDARCGPEELAQARIELLDTLEKVLKGANYKEISFDEIKKAHADRPSLRVKIATATESYHQVRFFRRGHRNEPRTIRKWFGLCKRLVETGVFDNVILMVTVKHASEINSRRQTKALLASQLRPGSILIKYFRQIAIADLHMLFPRVRVVMGPYDKMTIAIPALAGGLPLVANLIPTLTVLFLVAGFYLGLTGPVEHEQVVKALAALSGVGALVSLVMTQRLKYERLSLKYQKLISDHCYYRNVSNNAGIFDYVVGTAEEQECKEAFLAYYFLAISTDCPDQPTLDGRIEAWLKDTFGFDIDFEVEDALAKLERLGLLVREGDKLSVVSPNEALILLDQKWDNFFLFANEARNPAQEPISAQ
ncbi:MAG: DUF3754 domain-containing protein [Proteobacteria bacterium]|nr:DUF3754 domain-containing protein [Pseudomonadota bacterium]